MVSALRVAQAGTRLTVYRLLDIQELLQLVANFWAQRQSVIFTIKKFKSKRDRKSCFFIKFVLKDVELATD